MSIAVLVQVYDEVRRLAIAGSAVAPGDFRLKKLIPPLEQAGAKAPVFAKLAQAAQALVDSDEQTAAAPLLELATLVNAILYTQGETGTAGELKPLATTDLGTRSTQASARVLKPLLEALSSTGSGRLELVNDAVERGEFRDLRLVRPALNALDDPYPEIAQLIADKVLPGYGTAIVPELRTKLDIKGRGGHLHRLRLLHRLDPEAAREIVKRALDEGSKEMCVAAIECLGTTGDDLVYLLEQAKAKSKDVRAAALRALSRAGTSAREVVDAMKKAIDGPDLELIVDRVRQTRLPEIQEYVLGQAGKQLDETLAQKDAKKQGPAIARLQRLVLCLEGRTDAGAEALLLRCFEATPRFAAMKSAAPSGQDFNELLAHVLAGGTPKARKALVAAHDTLTGGMLPPALDVARQSMTPAKFFEEFSPLLAALGGKRAKKGAEHDRAAALAEALTSTSRRRCFRSSAGYVALDDDDAEAATPPAELDPRWVDAAIDAEALELVCQLARPRHARLNQFLSAQLNGKKVEDFQVLETMVRIGHPDAADAIIEQLRKQAKSTGSGYYGYWYGRLIANLPANAYPKFEAVLSGLPEKMVDQLMESVMSLKDKPHA